MKTKLIFVFSIFSLLLSNCRKEVVSLNPFEQLILESTVYSKISQLQSDKESRTLKNNSVKAMSFTREYTDSNKIDSLTYLRFNREGRLIQRTTNEMTTEGCLPNMIVQIFRYEDNKIKRVEGYTFKYKVNSVFEKWMETDTSRLNMFDWQDYNYNGDTIFIESGVAKWKYIKDKKGNIESSFLNIKATNQIADTRYLSTPLGVKIQVNNDRDKLSLKDYMEHEVGTNSVTSKQLLVENTSRTENIYNDMGLLIEKIHYKNDKINSRTRVTYYYFE
jgi:hypothetical protein